MNRSDKLIILRSALAGQGNALRALSKEARRNDMPFLDAYGVIDANQCPPDLLDLEVFSSDTNRGVNGRPAREFIQCLVDRVGMKIYTMPGTAITLLTPTDSQYDLVPLHSIQLKKRDNSEHTVSDCTIGDLRRCFGCCKSSVDKSFISLFFDAVPKVSKSKINLPI